MKIIELKESGAQTASTTGEWVDLFGDAEILGNEVPREIVFTLDVTAAATEAGDTLDVFVDMSNDESISVNVIHFTQVVGNGGAKRFVAKLTGEALNDPDAVADVSSDASAGVVRNLGFMPKMRYRSTIADAVTTSNVSFTYSLTAFVK